MSASLPTPVPSSEREFVEGPEPPVLRHIADYHGNHPGCQRARIRKALYADAWPPERIDEFARAADRAATPADKIRWLADRFLENRTPFEFEHDQAAIEAGVLRADLGAFDCATFIWSFV